MRFALPRRRHFYTYPNVIWRLFKRLSVERSLSLDFDKFSDMLRLRVALHSFAKSLLADPKPSRGVSLLEWGKVEGVPKQALDDLCGKALDYARDIYSSTERLPGGGFRFTFSTKDDSTLSRIVRKALGEEEGDPAEVALASLLKDLKDEGMGPRAVDAIAKPSISFYEAMKQRYEVHPELDPGREDWTPEKIKAALNPQGDED
jgi:hypothetical protein